MERSWTYDAADLEATRGVGAALGRSAPPGCPLLLVGRLGAGKTTLAQAVAAELGVKGRVTSPTFVLVREHTLDEPAVASYPEGLVHIDLYRASVNEARELGLEDYFATEQLVMVEWADKATALMPADALWLSIEVLPLTAGTDAGARRFVFRPSGPLANAWLDAVKQQLQ